MSVQVSAANTNYHDLHSSCSTLVPPSQFWGSVRQSMTIPFCTSSSSYSSIVKYKRHPKKFLEFFDANDLVHHELVPPGQSVTCRFCRTYAMLFEGSGVTSDRNNSSCAIMHPASYHLLCRNSSLRKTFIPVIIQPPYFLDLASSGFWLHPIVEMGLKRHVA
jgi:hypothetical protein